MVIVAGSVFGALSKKLIKRFSPEEPGKAKPLIGAAGAPAKLDRRGGPQHPVARPVRTTTQARPTPEPPVARPYPGSPPIARPMPSASPVARRSGPSQPVGPRRRPTAVQGRRPPVTGTEERLGHLKPHMEHLASAIEGQEDRIRAQVERDLGRIETTTGPATTTARTGANGGRKRKPRDPYRDREQAADDPRPDREGADLSVVSGLAGRLTHHALRRAIVLSEIIGPPIALRQSDERF